MSKQPEALRLADALDDAQPDDLLETPLVPDAADELRRLYKLNQELLKALKDPRSRYGYGNEDADYRAAIAKAEGEQQ